MASGTRILKQRALIFISRQPSLPNRPHRIISKADEGLFGNRDVRRRCGGQRLGGPR